MKSLLGLLYALLFVCYVANGQYVNNFTVQDIQGNTHELFPVLDEGKIVILAFFSMKSEMSAVYHEKAYLNSLYQTHGPNGTDKVRIYYIEADPTTPASCLSNSAACAGASGTVTNWLSGTPFPVINDDNLANTIGVSHVPTNVVICPGRRYKEVGFLNTTTLWESAQECPVPEGQNNIGIYYFDPGVPYGQLCGITTLNPKFHIVNVGSNPINGASVKIELRDLVVDTFSITGVMMPLDERVIIADDIVLNDTGTLKISVLPINNEFILDNNQVKKKFSKDDEFIGNTLKVRVRTDQYGDETYWQIRDVQTGEVVAEAGNYCVYQAGGGAVLDPTCSSPSTIFGDYSSNTYTVHLPHVGCYVFSILDAFGDGMIQCGSNNPCGYFIYEPPLYFEDAPIQGADFGVGETRGFNILTLVPTNEPVMQEEKALSVFPNPASDQLVVNWAATHVQRAQLSLTDAMGHVVYQTPFEQVYSGNHNWQVDVSGLPNGVYALLVSGEKEMCRKLFVKQSAQ